MIPPSGASSDAALTLDQVKQSPQWIVWRREAHQGRWTKVPYAAATGQRASATHPANWTTYERAQYTLKRSRDWYQGVGLVFCPTLLPVMGIDFDHCLDAQGRIAPWADTFLNHLTSYTEYSPSRQGVHVLLLGRMPAVQQQGIITHPGRKHTFRPAEGIDGHHPQAAVELYSEGRFFTVTEQPVSSFPLLLLPRQEQLLTLYHTLFGTQSARSPGQQHVGGGRFFFSDQALLEKAMAARNGPCFRALWHGQRGPDASRDDYSLCCLLAFWTGRDAARMDRLFRQSGLMRPKWDQPRGSQTYGQRTIAQAIAACTTIYHGSQRVTIHPFPKEDQHD
jgi:putative DNA primase/helicase